MSGILALARPDIVALKAYSHASWDPAFERLHANELPWRAETRSLAGRARIAIPSRIRTSSPQRLAALYGVRAAHLLPGRGSDESIDLLVRGFCRAGVDNVIICPPTFGMYAVAARIQGAAVREVPLLRERGFALDVDGVLAACDANTRIVFLCSPNNPTGNAMDPAAVERLLDALAGRALVVVDEAYIEFSRRRVAGGVAGAVSESRRAAHAVQGLRPGRRARRLADRAAPRSSRCSRKVIPPYSIPQLTIEAVLATLAPAQLAIQRERVAAGARRARAPARRAGGAAGRAPRLAERREFPAGRLRRCRRPRSRAARDAKLLIRDMRSRRAAQHCASPWARPSRTIASSGACA